MLVSYDIIVFCDGFSTQGTEKGGGYVNRLVVTCVRTGLNRTFRVMQKPERAPIRALRASASGRFYSHIHSFYCSHFSFFKNIILSAYHAVVGNFCMRSHV